MSGTTTPTLTSAHVDWFLTITHLNAVRRRVEREGLTEDVAHALAQGQANLTAAAIALDLERRRTIASMHEERGL